jgi:predicted metalloprotease
MRGVGAIAALSVTIGLAFGCGGEAADQGNDSPEPPQARAAPHAPVSDPGAVRPPGIPPGAVEAKPTAVVANVVDQPADDAQHLRALLNAAAQSINNYWAVAVPEVYGRQYVPPRIAGPYDPARVDLVCGGQSVPGQGRGNAFYCRPDNFIAWDEPTFLLDLYRRVTNLAAVFVLAHEWGHAIQAQLRVQYPNTIDSELGADCLAGAWADVARQAGELTREDFDRALETLTSLQDPDQLPWTDPQAHGTAYERTRAFGDGVESGPTACVAP